MMKAFRFSCAFGTLSAAFGAGAVALLIAACTGAPAPATPTQGPTAQPVASPKAATPASGISQPSPPAASPAAKASPPTGASPASAPKVAASPTAQAAASPTPAATGGGGSPREAVTQSFSSIVSARSFRFRGIINQATASEEITGEFVFPDAAHVVSSGGEIILLGDVLYVKDPSGTWRGIRTGATGPGGPRPPLFDFGQAMQSLAAAQEFTIVGQEVVDGTPTTIYAYTETEGGRPTQTKVWIGNNDQLPRKVEVSEGGQVAATFFYSDYGRVPEIRAPEGAEILDPKQLGSGAAPPMPLPTQSGDY